MSDRAKRAADFAAAKLAGDMPWVTEHLTRPQYDDLVKQMSTAMRVHAEAEIADLEAEVTRHAEANHETQKLLAAAVTENARLEAENARLRGALVRIAGYDASLRASTIAKEALK